MMASASRRESGFRKPMLLPHLVSPRVLHMGLSPISTVQWIEAPKHSASWLEHKLQTRGHLGTRVYAAGADTLPAQRELCSTLLDHLLTDHPGRWRLHGETLCLPGGHHSAPLQSPEPLWTASLWVPEDLLLMQADAKGAYRLTAASLCSPSHWQLEEKLGHTLPSIHSVIPGFARQLDERIARFFRHLRVENPVERYNWSLQRGVGRCQRQGSPEVGQALHYRVERQTLRRLPETGAVVFGIRVHLYPLAQLAEHAGALEALLAAIDACPPALASYKGFPELAEALGPWRARLDRSP